MADFATLWLKLKNQQFNAGLDKSNLKTKSLGMSGLKLAAIFSLASLPLVIFGKNAVKAASDAQEAADKFGTVFEGAGTKAEKTAQRIAKSYGIAVSTSKELLSSTGDILSGFGFTDKKSLELSKRVTALGADLASFSNIEGGTKKAVTALTKALVGETESAKILGVVIRQDSKEFKKLVEEGMRMRGETLLQAKAMASLTIAISQSQKAIGDTQRTWGSFANTSKRLAESYKGFKEEIGKVLIETLNLSAGMGDLDTTLSNLTNKIKKDGKEWVFVFKTWVIELTAAIDQAWNVISGLWSNITPIFKAAGANIASLVSFFVDVWSKGLDGAWSLIKGFARDVADLFSGLAKELINAITFKDTNFAGVFADIGKNIESEMAKLDIKLPEIVSPDFSKSKSFSDIAKAYKQIERDRQKAQDKLFNDGMKNANAIKKIKEDTDKVSAKTLSNTAQGFTQATFAGTVEAQQREFGISTTERKTEKNTADTAKYTKASAKANERLAQTFERPLVFKMA